MLHLAELPDRPVYDYGNTPKILKNLIVVLETYGILLRVTDKLAAKGSALAPKVKEQIEAKKKAVDNRQNIKDHNSCGQ
jgi:hypothetical protein